jgi:hypothetical protein
VCIFGDPLLIAAIGRGQRLFEYEWDLKGLQIETKEEL